MIPNLVLDSTPAGLLTLRRGKSADAEQCKTWVERLRNAGVNFYLPEIVDFEVRRELVRLGHSDSIQRLDLVKTASLYIPITTESMLLAADLWANARQLGRPTADSKELDIDVILAAQVQCLDIPKDEVIVATATSVT